VAPATIYTPRKDEFGSARTPRTLLSDEMVTDSADTGNPFASLRDNASDEEEDHEEDGRSPSTLRVSTPRLSGTPRINLGSPRIAAAGPPSVVASSPKVAGFAKDVRVYKTELCKKFESSGECPYGPKCQFAHGKRELRDKKIYPGTTRAPVAPEIDDDGSSEAKLLDIEPVRRPPSSAPPVMTTSGHGDKGLHLNMTFDEDEDGEGDIGIEVLATEGDEVPKSPAAMHDPRLYKTELCRSFNKTGYCRYGLKCQFAHGIQELRPSPKVLTPMSHLKLDMSRVGTVNANGVFSPSLNDTPLELSPSKRNLSGSPVVGAAYRAKMSFDNSHVSSLMNISPPSTPVKKMLSE